MSHTATYSVLEIACSSTGKENGDTLTQPCLFGTTGGARCSASWENHLTLMASPRVLEQRKIRAASIHYKRRNIMCPLTNCRNVYNCECSGNQSSPLYSVSSYISDVKQQTMHINFVSHWVERRWEQYREMPGLHDGSSVRNWNSNDWSRDIVWEIELRMCRFHLLAPI